MQPPSPPAERPRLVGELRRSVASTRTEPDHAHDTAEFMLVMSGTGRFFVGHQVHDLRPGTLIWQLSAQRHRLQRGPNLEMWVAQLHEDSVFWMSSSIEGAGGSQALVGSSLRIHAKAPAGAAPS